MGYRWNEHKDTCRRLYIEEGRTLDDVMRYMKEVHNFAPSKRAYQNVFCRWGFNTKQNPAHKNANLVERVRQLWEKNLNAREMLRVLTEEDGFDINHRELTRVRSKFRLLLRAPDGDRAQMQASEATETPSQITDRAQRRDASASVIEADSSKEPRGEDPGLSHPVLRPSSQSSSRGSNAAASNTLSIRKQRRLRAQAANPDQDWVGFPSEMTYTRARKILGLDEGDGSYKSFRDRFQAICREEDVAKKTIAGPQKWEAVKRRLIDEMPHLQSVLARTGDKANSPALALDVLCQAVTKIMRTSERKMTLPQAKNILGLNPAQVTVMRAALHVILKQAHFTTKTDASPEQWQAIMRKWGDLFEPIKGIVLTAGSDSVDQEKSRALKLMARDIVRRFRTFKPSKPSGGARNRHAEDGDEDEDEEEGEEGEEQGDNNQDDGVGHGHGSFSEAHQGMSEAHQGMSEAHQGMSEAHQGMSGPTNESPPTAPTCQASMVLDPETTSSSTTEYESASNPVVASRHAQAPMSTVTNAERGPSQSTRMLDPSTPSALSLGSHIGPTLLTMPNSHTSYMNQSPANHPFASASSPHQVGYQNVVREPSAVAAYLRLHPTSSFVTNASLWIATLHSPSVRELRRAAVESFPSAVCVRVEGVLKDGRGNELSLPIEQDQELAAYLAHLQGAAPTFNVQLAWRTA